MLSSDFPVLTDILSELCKGGERWSKGKGRLSDWDIHYMTLLHLIFIIQIRQIIQFTKKIIHFYTIQYTNIKYYYLNVFSIIDVNNVYKLILEN